VPRTECLKDTVARVVPYWEQAIAPQVRAGKRVLVAAHGNSLRALVKHLVCRLLLEKKKAIRAGDLLAEKLLVDPQRCAPRTSYHYSLGLFPCLFTVALRLAL